MQCVRAWYLRSPAEGSGSPRTGVADSCDLGLEHQVCWKSKQCSEPLSHLFSLYFLFCDSNEDVQLRKTVKLGLLDTLKVKS